jgi:hypothetical protein
VYVADVLGAEGSAVTPVTVRASATAGAAALASQLDALLSKTEATGDAERTLQVRKEGLGEGPCLQGAGMRVCGRPLQPCRPLDN